MKASDLFEETKLGLTIFDIDDTLFRTTAQIKVVKDGREVRSLTNQEFNTYQLQDGESFDFGEFRNAEKFNKESIPIGPMIAKLNAIIKNAGASKVIMLTARADFDNKDLFLDTFRKYGVDMNKVHVHRAGNLGIAPAESKAVWIRKYLDTGKFGRVRLYDDAMSNLRMFIGLKKEYPSVEFFPYFVTHEGNIRTVREGLDKAAAKGTKAEAGYQPNPKNGQKCINCTMWRDPNKCSAVAGNIDPDGWCDWYAGGAYGKRGKRVNEDGRYTAAEWAIISGGHSLEVPTEKPKLFDWNKY